MRARDRAVPPLSGEVRLAVTEGLGTFWLAPRLVEFQRAHPQLLVDLSCAMQSADVLRLEADAAVQLTKPTILILSREAWPTAFNSVRRPKLISIPTGPEDNRRASKASPCPAVRGPNGDAGDLRSLVSRRAPRGFVALRTNVSSAHYLGDHKRCRHWLAADLCCMRSVREWSRDIDLDLDFSFDIWLTYHADAVRIPRVRRMIDWVIDSFDPERFPWFRDEFIHPNDLPNEYRGRTA